MAEASSTDRVVGTVMLAAAFGAILAMAHHPSGPNEGPLSGIVHGSMIVLLMLIAFGFGMFAIARGPSRPLIVAGLIAYAVSLFAHIGAALINGFIVPALAGPGASPVSHDFFRLLWDSNQALAKLGVYATGAAYALWSIDLLSDRASAAKLAGGLGLAAGIVPAALLASGLIRMDVAGAFIVYAAHVGWAALIGLMFLRGGLIKTPV